jgi:PhnB protein
MAVSRRARRWLPGFILLATVFELLLPVTGLSQRGAKSMQTITPYLYYEDVDAALEWLAQAFGFKEYGKRFAGAGGKTNHAAMKLGGSVVMMGQPGPKYKSPKRLGQATFCVQMMVKDVDKLFDRAKKAGATILQPPEDKFYGLRQFGAADLEGHNWFFAQPIKKAGQKNARAKAT